MGEILCSSWRCCQEGCLLGELKDDRVQRCLENMVFDYNKCCDDMLLVKTSLRSPIIIDDDTIRSLSNNSGDSVDALPSVATMAVIGLLILCFLYRRILRAEFLQEGTEVESYDVRTTL